MDRFSKLLWIFALVFPNGPVTLRLPVEWTKADGPATAELSVTYMACSATTCLTPVIDKRVSVVLPQIFQMLELA